MTPPGHRDTDTKAHLRVTLQAKPACINTGTLTPEHLFGPKRRHLERGKPDHWNNTDTKTPLTHGPQHGCLRSRLWGGRLGGMPQPSRRTEDHRVRPGPSGLRRSPTPPNLALPDLSTARVPSSNPVDGRRVTDSRRCVLPDTRNPSLVTSAATPLSLTLKALIR